jgi:hypothetical protein
MDEQRNSQEGRDGRPDELPDARTAEVGAAGGALVGLAVGGPPGA